MQLSKREQKLLWGLINVGVLLVGIKFVLPEVNQYYQASVEKLQKNEADALQAEILLLEEKELPSRLEQYKEELKQIESYYFAKLDEEYMQAWIMAISEKYPIQIEALTIEELHMQDEEGLVEILPIGMTVQGEEQAIIDFLDALLNSQRYVILEQLEMEQVEVEQVEIVQPKTEQSEIEQPETGQLEIEQSETEHPEVNQEEVEQLKMQQTKARIKIGTYRTQKEEDELEKTPFITPAGKDALMRREDYLDILKKMKGEWSETDTDTEKIAKNTSDYT